MAVHVKNNVFECVKVTIFLQILPKKKIYIYFGIGGIIGIYFSGKGQHFS